MGETELKYRELTGCRGRETRDRSRKLQRVEAGSKEGKLNDKLLLLLCDIYLAPLLTGSRKKLQSGCQTVGCRN
ncbi:hypothetical protein XELAEV_18024692mg [Xenopus laevis]|uniref:Uncharacterized protein n=1 Tax=Xenopus laevis TaxID=8355 RepID=A0A974D0I3_XENLA|nr:hypothetical protein XELAEV_18024692mg [Xenopus laevis]